MTPFSGDDMRQFLPFVHRFSLMTYDYSAARVAGPNAPLQWVREATSRLGASAAALRPHILMGVPFYGNDWAVGGGHAQTMLGRDVLERLQDSGNRHVRFEWHPQTAEHTLEYTDARNMDHIAYVPTQAFLEARAALAAELGVGIAIWEIGQGLDHFFDVL